MNIDQKINAAFVQKFINRIDTGKNGKIGELEHKRSTLLPLTFSICEETEDELGFCLF